MSHQNFQPQNADILLAKIDINDKQNLIERISTEVAQKTGISAAGIYTRLMQKENSDGSGIGDGTALPHAKILQLKKPISILITLRNKIDLSANDSQPVDIIYALFSPRSDGALHLQRLSAATRMLKDKEFCDQLREAADHDQLADIMQSSSSWMTVAA